MAITMIISHEGRSSMIAAFFLAILLDFSEAQQGCCSQNHRTCASWLPATASLCATHGDGTMVWLPDGAQDQCIQRWRDNACTLHENCCGTLVCDGMSWNLAQKQCRHPVELCDSFNNDGTLCNSRSSCEFKDNKCVPNFDYNILDPSDFPADEGDPACCSQDHRTCPLWTPKTEEACAASTDKMVWRLEGAAQEQCIDRWSSSTSCSLHEDCCGTLVCDGMSWNIAEKRCRHPVDLCASFDNEPFCETRSSCDWKDGKCVPNFDVTVNDPANVPPNIPDDPGCCSQNHFECGSRNSKTQTHAQCAEFADGKYLWIPEGSGMVPNAATCKNRWDQGECDTHDDCCGSMICASAPWDALTLQCRHPLDVCGGQSVRQFCNEVPGCAWDKNDGCVPAFDYTIVEPDAKLVLPTPLKVLSATDGNADYLGLCEGFVGTVWGDPHFVTFDRRKYDCQVTGAFTLAKSEGELEIQGMLHKKIPSFGASVLVGLVVDYPAVPSIPRIQLNFAEYDSGDDTTLMVTNKCGAHLYLDGQLQEINRGDAIVTEDYVIVSDAKSNKVDIQFFKNGEDPTIAIRVTARGEPQQSLGCVMDAKICLPFNEPDLLEGTTGLLGTPNGDRTDEWIVPGTGEVLELVQYGAEPFGFCTNHYCVERESDSLFVYEELSHKDRYSCSNDFPGEVDLSSPPDDILAICGEEDAECLMEGILGGQDAAIRKLDIEQKIEAIALTPGLTPDATFDIPSLPPAAAEEECMLNPEDVVNSGSKYCPTNYGVVAEHVEGTSSSPGDVDILWDISGHTNADGSSSVQFKVQNPFPATTDLFVRYDHPTGEGGLEQACEKHVLEPCGGTVAVPITAKCLNGGGNPFTLVQLYFVDTTDSLADQIFGPVDVHECCHPGDIPATTVAHYSFLIPCSCPAGTPARRQLLRGMNDNASFYPSPDEST